MDPGYALAAGRRRTAPAGPGDRNAPSDARSRLGRLVDGAKLRTAILVTLVGTVLGFGIHQVRLSGQVGASSRSALIGQVTARQQDVSAQTATAARLRQQVANARSERLTASGQGSAVQQQLKVVEAAAAVVAVTGPGITVTLSDAPPPPAEGGQLTDRDLQSVVNALWGSGAEAIAVGGHRLGPQTAIRTAGQAVLVDFQPIASPYAIDAIGDPNLLTSGLADSPAGRRLRTLHAVYGVGLKVASTAALTLPAAAPSTPRSASALTSTSATPGPGGTP